MDENVREKERRWHASGSVEDEAAYERARNRAEVVKEEEPTTLTFRQLLDQTYDGLVKGGEWIEGRAFQTIIEGDRSSDTSAVMYDGFRKVRIGEREWIIGNSKPCMNHASWTSYSGDLVALCLEEGTEFSAENLWRRIDRCMGFSSSLFYGGVNGRVCFPKYSTLSDSLREVLEDKKVDIIFTEDRYLYDYYIGCEVRFESISVSETYPLDYLKIFGDACTKVLETVELDSQFTY